MKKNISDKVKNILDRVPLGETGIRVSPVGCGVLPMGPGQLALPVEEGAKLICYALSKGINFIDTAQYYRTYPYIRRALEMLGSRPAEMASACAAANPVPIGDKIDNPPISSVPISDIPRPIISSKTLASDYESAYAAICEEGAAFVFQ